MRIVRIILIIIGLASTLAAVIVGKYGLAGFNLVVAFMNYYFLIEED